jgi:hypothetical protein
MSPILSSSCIAYIVLFVGLETFDKHGTLLTLTWHFHTRINQNPGPLQTEPMSPRMEFLEIISVK